MSRNHITFKFLIFFGFAAALLALLLLVMTLAVAITPGHAQDPEELVFVYKAGQESAAMPVAINYTGSDLLSPGRVAVETPDSAIALLDDVAVIGTPEEPTSWTLEGRVYKGAVGDENQPIAGVTVSVYGANKPYPDQGVLIASTTTDEHGWYGIEVSDRYEFYSIHENDPTGYTSVGATSVDGTVRTSNWIEYQIPLEEQKLTGNKFWDRVELEPPSRPAPAPEGPDLAILSTDNWRLDDDGQVLVLLVKIANQGDTRANQTQVYAWDPASGWLSEDSSVPALLPGEDEWVGLELAIPEEQRGLTHSFRVEVDPEEMVTELNERNNIEWTPGIFISPLEVTPGPTEPSPAPTATPVHDGPDSVPLILIVVAIVTLGGITLVIRHYTITQHHKKWQEEAKEEEPPEHCQYCTHHCRRIELELDPAMRKIAYLSLGAYDPVHGEQIKEGHVKVEIVDGLNKVVAARHRIANAEKLQEPVTSQAQALLQQIMGLLREEAAPRDLSITGHLEGGKVTCQFILYHCKRRGNVNIWEEEAKWEATIKDERDEPVGTLHSIAPSEPGISERLTPALTRLLMQFIEKV